MGVSNRKKLQRRHYPDRSAIKWCYSKAGVPCPLIIHACSARAQTSLAAFLRGVPLKKICRVATWSSAADTIVRHQALDLDARREASVCQDVLQSMFQ